MVKFRIVVSLSIFVTTLLGFYSKIYSGYGADWFNNSLGGFFYEIFWCLLFSMIFIKTRSWKIALNVFVFTCFLEFLQLWNLSILEMIRSTFLGRTIIGTTFVSSDFIYYFFGSLASWILLNWIKKITNSGRT